MILQLGCGMRPMTGAVNHDRVKHSPWVVTEWDLDQRPWPWAEGQFGQIAALDVMEHLRLDVADWLDECWRILWPGGTLHLRLAGWDEPMSYRDPTHRRVFHLDTFDFWDKRSPLWHYYGRVYFGERGRWWRVEEKHLVHGRDVEVLLRKES